MKPVLALIAITTLCLLFRRPVGLALDPFSEVSQCAHTAWTIRDGF